MQHQSICLTIDTYFCDFSYSGNTNLRKGKSERSNTIIIIGSSVGAAILLLVTIASCVFINRGKKRYSEEGPIVEHFFLFVQFFLACSFS